MGHFGPSTNTLEVLAELNELNKLNESSAAILLRTIPDFSVTKIGCVNLSGATSPSGCGFVFNGLIISDINIQTECTSTYGAYFSKINMLFVFNQRRRYLTISVMITLQNDSIMSRVAGILGCETFYQANRKIPHE